MIKLDIHKKTNFRIKGRRKAVVGVVKWKLEHFGLTVSTEPNNSFHNTAQ